MTTNKNVIPSDSLSIPELFHERVKRSARDQAYHYFDKNTKQWHTLTWEAMETKVAIWRQALSLEQLSPGDRVAIMLPNCLSWSCFDLAALSLGLVVVPLYANDRADNVAYILNDTKSKVFLCENLSFWTKLQLSDNKLDSLQLVLTAEGLPDSDENLRVTCLSDWLTGSGDIQAAQLPQPDDLATIVYTSGTTGRPKGVMLSHRNILGNASGGLSCIAIRPGDIFLSFLPLSHMLERTAGYYLPMMAGASVAYARSIQELSEDLTWIKPTVLVAVPRIFERLYSKISIAISKQSSLMQTVFKMATNIGWRHYLYHQHRGNWSMDFFLQPLLDKMVGKKVRTKLGGRLRVVISGGAPLSFPVAKALVGLGIPIYQGYGLTESSPVISVNRPEDNRPESVGPPLPGIETKTSEDGELLVRGSCVMLGYWQNPEATAQAIDREGWLHTGDVAAFDGEHLKITGRLKEILVLSNSEKISPTDIETAIASDPLFEQSMIVGEGRPYLTLLAVLNPELWQQLAEELNLPPEDGSLANVQVRSEIMRRVERCLRNFPGFAWVRNINISLKPWTVEQGFLTPTLKLRRKIILNSMRNEVEQMYQT